MRPLQIQRDALLMRLDRGWERIEQGLAAGEDVFALESFWVGLLGEYERVEDAIARETVSAAQERAQAGPLVQGRIGISAGVR